MPEDEWQAISLSYTSGTTGNPKGVVYHHRGSYLMATGSAVAWNMPNRLNFLTIVPMFHCNGWCYPWTCLLYTSPSPRDRQKSRMPSSA